jgi:hypothetical protein
MVHSRDWIDPVDYPDDCWVSPCFRAVLLKGQLTFARNIRRRKRGSMNKMKFSTYQPKQSRIVEGVCVPISYGLGDYDELLREAVRVALRMDMNPAHDDWDDLYDRIRKLMAAYIASPEGEGEDACTLMTRLAACVADVIPITIRKGLITPSSTGATPQTQLPDGGSRDGGP